MIAVTALVLVLSVLVLVCLLAQMDQYRTLETVRDHFGVGDAPQPLTYPAGPVVPSEIGLPARFDDADHVVLLFLSTSCATCATIARGLRSSVPPDLHIVVRAASQSTGESWVADVGLGPQHATVAGTDSIADAFGLRVTPAAFVVHRNRVVAGQTVPSSRQLNALIDQRAALARTTADAPPSAAPLAPHQEEQPWIRS